MLDFFLNIDYSLFKAINAWNSPFFDVFFSYISGKYIWIPFYIFLLVLIIKDYKRRAILIFLFIPILVLLTDQISVQCFKNVFERLRPCHDPLLKDVVHIVNGKCGGKYGFVSSHAANTFGLAYFLLPFFHHRKWMKWVLLLPFAGLISYSRIYLGVHFPADVMVGGLLGASIGFLLSLLLLGILKSKFINSQKFFH